MAGAPELTVAEHVVFEPDEVTFADNRLTVTGRWFGVRGRRFVRPTLSLGQNGAGSRVLADLEHKPWPAEDGEPWTAAFALPAGSGGSDEIELAVAPDIAVVLGAPEALRALPKRPAGGRARSGISADRSAATTADRRNGGSGRGAGNGPGGNAMAASQAKVEEQHAEITRLRERLTRNEVAKAELNAAVSKRDAAVAKLDAVLEERDAALEARDAALEAREAAVTARDSALAARDAAGRERDAAVAEREAARAERGGFSDEFQRLMQERDALAHERDELRRRHREHERAQTALSAERDLLRAQLEQAQAARRSTATPAVSPAPSPSPAAAPTSAPVVPTARTRSQTAVWITRAIALGVLVVVVVALLLIIGSV